MGSISITFDNFYGLRGVVEENEMKLKSAYKMLKLLRVGQVTFFHILVIRVSCPLGRDIAQYYY